jgi:genome maintenance exonuclease 1
MALMKWNKLYKYPPCTRSITDGIRTYEIGEERLPSVTTILDATKSEESRRKLNEWILLKGKDEANRIKNQAAERGTAMHTYLEKYVGNTGHLDLTDTGRVAKPMAETVIKQGLNGKLSEIWGTETTLYYPGLYAGVADMVGVYDYEDSIIDFKQSNRPKRKEWVEDYFMQVAAYAVAHNYVYRTQIRQGVILMCTPDCFFQKFVVKGKEFVKYQHKFLEKVGKYGSN